TRVHTGPTPWTDAYSRCPGKPINKHCTFFLSESKNGAPVPQTDQAITDCAWHPADAARRTISYDNARAVLEQATAMVQALAHVDDASVGGGGEGGRAT